MARPTRPLAMTSHRTGSAALRELDASEGVLKSATVNDTTVGRSVDETVRTVQALQTGKLTGCGWKPGEKTLS